MSTNAAPINAAIIGSGNIGTDLMIKMLRSNQLTAAWMVGIEPESEGLARAKQKGLKTTHKGIDDFLDLAANDNIKLAFDATSAYVHPENSRKLEAAGIRVIDLTPAAIGPYCIPPVNLEELIGAGASNVNMVSCGGQATIPIVAAISSVHTVDYAEIIATISSKSAGPGTRKNIDEFTRTTAAGLEQVGRAKQGKAIIILNPAEPPMLMRDTVHCIIDCEPDEEAVTKAILAMIKKVQKYVPGYRLKNGPVFDGQRISTYLEVEGLGDFLPSYAGNLDIMTAAAMQTGEMLAQEISQT